MSKSKLERAEATLAAFKRNVDNGAPWLPGVEFINNPGLDKYIIGALEEFVRVQRVAEQSKPAKRESIGVDDVGVADQIG